MRPEGVTVTVKVRPVGSATVYVAPVVAFPNCPKIGLAVEVRLIFSGIRMLLLDEVSPATEIAAPPQLVLRNCNVLVVCVTHTGLFDLIASCRPWFRYALKVCAPARTRALR